MMRFNIIEARKQIGKIVDLVQLGEEVVITRYGKDMVKLVPVKEVKVKEVKQLSSREKTRSKIKIKGKPLSQVVTEERRKGSRY